MKPAHDVVIIGAGPAGLAAAIAVLRQPGASVLVADAQEPGRLRVGESVPPDIVLLLARLGLAAAFRSGGHEPCPGYASVWGSARPGYNDFIVNPLGPAWRLDRQAFDGMLAAAAVSAGATVRWSTRFTGAARLERGAGFRLRFRDARTGHTHQTAARIVVDASGPRAAFCAGLGVARTVEDTLLARVRFARISSGELSGQVRIEATPDGWWYTAPLPHRRLVTMVVGTRAAIGPWAKGGDGRFAAALAATSFIGPSLAALSVEAPSYRTTPVASGWLEQVEGPGWIAAGDAAASFDPVAAQGLYKALHTGIEAAARVTACLRGGAPEASGYSDLLRKMVTAYRRNRAHLYGLERRWPTAPFWQQRPGRVGPAA